MKKYTTIEVSKIDENTKSFQKNAVEAHWKDGDKDIIGVPVNLSNSDAILTHYINPIFFLDGVSYMEKPEYRLIIGENENGGIIPNHIPDIICNELSLINVMKILIDNNIFLRKNNGGFAVRIGREWDHEYFDILNCDAWAGSIDGNIFIVHNAPLHA